MMNVLFVDDDKNLLNSFRRVLQPYAREYNFYFADGGEEAMRLSLDSPPDILFTDSQMPGMTGRELIKTMTESFPGLISVLISGNLCEEDAMEDFGNQYCLDKPCKMSEILKILKEYGT